MMRPQPLLQVRISIVGLGLMGGSLALALRGKCAEIIGVDVDEVARQQAVKQGVVDFASSDLREGVARANMLVLATPVQTILNLINQLKHLPDPDPSPLPILDLGSTKTEIARAMADLPAHFDPVGGHPMCGKETPGLPHAEASLFAGATFALTPLDRTTSGVMTLARELVAAVGARALVLDPARHDDLTAMISHMPYLVACSLLSAAADVAEDDELIWALASSGFRDMTRLTASDARVMLDILRTNRGSTRAALNRMRAALDRMEALLVDDRDDLKNALQAIRAERLRRFPR